MCGRTGPSKAEIEAQERANELQAEQALLQRQEADEARRAEAERKAQQKAENIEDVLQSRGGSTGAQRRTLFSTGSRGQGFLGRF